MDMPMDKFRLYIEAITFKRVSGRANYIHDIVSVISGIFGAKNNKIVSNHLKTLDM